MPSKSKADLIKTIEAQATMIKALEASNTKIYETLHAHNCHLSVLVGMQKTTTEQVSAHSSQLSLIANDLTKLQATVAEEPHEAKPFNKQVVESTVLLKLAHTPPGGNISGLAATEERERDDMIASAVKRKYHERSAGPARDRHNRTTSSMTANEGGGGTDRKDDEGAAQKDDERPAHDKAAEANGKTPEDHEDAPLKSATDITPEVREEVKFWYEYDLADIATTLAVAPQSQGCCVPNLSSRARRCREYPDRYVDESARPR